MNFVWDTTIYTCVNTVYNNSTRGYVCFVCVSGHHIQTRNHLGPDYTVSSGNNFHSFIHSMGVIFV